MRPKLFICTLLLTFLAFAQGASAAPTTQSIGGTRVTLTLQPDPPTVGTIHATVQMDPGHGPLTIRFSTSMPSMGMNGASGFAVPAGSDRYAFDIPVQMAAPWTVTLTLSGSVSGTASFPFTVVGGSAQIAGDGSAWRTAAIALIVIILVGALVVRRDRRTSTLAWLAVAGLVVVGLAVAQARYGSLSMDMASMQSVGGVAPIPVTLALVRDDASRSSFSAPASVEPYLTQSIVARAPGLLTDFVVYTGDRLRAGQVVARLDEPELGADARAANADASAAQSEIQIAQHEVASATADLAAKREQARYWATEIARERVLLDQGAVSRREYDDERAQATAAQSAFDSSHAKLASAAAGVQGAAARAASAFDTSQSRAIAASYENVIVPDDSIVMKRLVDPGVFVQAGTPILQVAVVDRLRVQAQVSQRDLAGISLGTPVDVAFDDGMTLHGRVSSISPVVDPQTHTAIVEAIVPAGSAVSRAGSYARATFQGRSSGRGAASLSVPSGALVGGATSAIWLDQSGSAHRVAVTIVSDDGTMAHVTGDIRAGARVVVAGAANLEEGQSIVEVSP